MISRIAVAVLLAASIALATKIRSFSTVSDVAVYRHPPFFPIVQIEAAHEGFDDPSPVGEPPAMCASVAAHLSGTHR